MSSYNLIDKRLKHIKTQKNNLSNSIKILENQNIILNNKKDSIKESANNTIRKQAFKYFATGALATVATMIATYFLDTYMSFFTMYETIRKIIFVPGITGIALMINSYPLATRKWPKTYDKDITNIDYEILENEKQIKNNKDKIKEYDLIENELETILYIQSDTYEDVILSNNKEIKKTPTYS